MTLRPNFKHLYVLVIFSIVLSCFVVKVPTSFDLQSVALYLSAVAGYSGIMSLLWIFILGSRTVSALFSNDYAKIIQIHSLMSKYGTLLIFLHPLLVMVSYGESLSFALLPNFSSAFENYISYGKSAIYLILIIWISSALLKKRISHRPWKYIHLAAYISVPFALLHIPFTGSSYMTMFSAQLYFLITTIGFITFFIIRLRGIFNIDKYKYKITANTKITSGIFELKLTPIDDHMPEIKPGQYIYLKLNKIGEEHPFSMYNYDRTTGEITIGYKTCGKFTDKMSAVKVGIEIYISGPFGQFTQDITNEPAVYIAGGIGIAPFAYRILNEANQREQWLFYVNRTNNDAAFNCQLKSACPDKVISINTRESSNDANTETGHLQFNHISKYLKKPENYTYYICGPAPMIKATKETLINAGINPKNIHKELFSF